MGLTFGAQSNPQPIRGFGVKIDQYTNDVDLKDEANVKLWEAIGGTYFHLYALCNYHGARFDE